MAADELKEIIVSPEDATFWLDRWGYWCNAHGRFEHKKIIDHFHAAIRWDEQGYHVTQVNGDFREKVYFRYEDTALFVFDILTDEGITLVLNTRQQMELDPGALFIRNDYLYLRRGKALIKFNELSMLKISRLFEHEGDTCFITIKGERTVISEMHDGSPH